MIQFYNTLTRKKEEFKPLKDKEVRIYTCGPTVYDFAHIGNLRTYIFADVLRRTLELAGFKVKQVMNITDVGHLTGDQDEGEDKIEKGARRENKAPEQIAQFYSKAFLSDLKKINIEKPSLMPKATDHIGEMVETIKKIEKEGFAYETDDGVYFDTSKLENYGQLSKQKSDQKRQSRIKKIKGKKNPTDFALWLKAVGKHKNHLQVWDSPWGKGFPGWHIECTAMSEKYLGQEFDIHTGGVDHIPVHHENEIAQSLAAFGRVPAKFWMHGQFLIIDSKRMGKSEGNLKILSDLKKEGFSPIEFRFMVLRNHYRSKMEFNLEKLAEAKRSLRSLQGSIKRLLGPQTKTVILESNALAGKIKNRESEIKKLFFDDLNTPKVIDILFETAHYLNKLKSEDKIGEAEIKNTLKRIFLLADSVLGLGLEELIHEEKIIPPQIIKLAEKRLEAKKLKNYDEADKIRKEIERAGYYIEDKKDKISYRIIKK